MFFSGSGRIIINPADGGTTFSRNKVPSQVLSSSIFANPSSVNSEQYTVIQKPTTKQQRKVNQQQNLQQSQQQEHQHYNQTYQQEQQRHLHHDQQKQPNQQHQQPITDSNTYYCPEIPSTHPITYPMRPTSREIHKPPHRPAKKNSSKLSRTVARNIDRRIKSKNRVNNAKRRDAYKITAKDGRVTQLASAKGNAFNARPQSSSSSKSRNTWVPTRGSSAYQAPRSTIMDTAFTSMAGVLPSSYFASNNSPSSSTTAMAITSQQQQRRRNPRHRRPFKDMLEVQKLTQYQQILNERSKKQRISDINMITKLGVRRNVAINWCNNEMNIALRILLNHISIINDHRSCDFVDLQMMLEEKKSATTNITTTTNNNKNILPISFTMYECREEARVEREEELLIEVTKLLRNDTTHEEGTSDLEDYIPILEVDLRKALNIQRNQLVQMFRLFSMDQIAIEKKLNKYSAIKIQNAWTNYCNKKIYRCAVIIQQRWAKYMCSILNQRMYISSSRNKWSAIKIQKFWRYYHKLKLSYKQQTELIIVYKMWLNDMTNNNEYDFYDHDVNHSCVVIQSCWRIHKSKQLIDKKKNIESIKLRSKRRKRWEKRRGGKSIKIKRDIYLAHRRLVMWNTHLTSEMEHIKCEMAREHRSMARAWRRWENHMRKQVYNKNLPKDWIAQIDTGPNPWTKSTKGGGWNDILKKGEEVSSKVDEKEENFTGNVFEKQLWLNMKTGETTDIHPHAKEADELRARESQKCQIILKERIEHLEAYHFKLSKALESHQSIISQRIEILREKGTNFVNV